MFILFSNAFVFAFTTTQPSMDFDASNSPFTIGENTQHGLYVNDEYVELIENDYDYNHYYDYENQYDYENYYK